MRIAHYSTTFQEISLCEGSIFNLSVIASRSFGAIREQFNQFRHEVRHEVNKVASGGAGGVHRHA